MRISDWSSDVCSSDLLVRRLAIPADAARQRHKRFARARLGGQVDDAAAEFAGKIRRIAFLNEGRIDDVGRKDVERDAALQRLGAGQRRDRKSVVSGKSGSVRVDLGGRRTIKKKKNKN